MDELAVSKLFQQFKQAQRLTGGTGLGLYSLAKRIEALGGAYGVSKRRDGQQGSLFWFTIPYRPDSLSLVAPSDCKGDALVGTKSNNSTPSTGEMTPFEFTRRTEVYNYSDISPVQSPVLFGSEAVKTVRVEATTIILQESAPVTEPKNLNILLVDDSLSIVKMSGMMLRRQGHTVTVAENGAEALQLMSANLQPWADSPKQDGGARNNYKQVECCFDVVLMDLQMPIMDGLESTSRLRKLEAATACAESTDNTATSCIHQLIIGCSANSDNDTMQAAFVAGIDAFIPKPFNIAEFNDSYQRLKFGSQKHTRR